MVSKDVNRRSAPDRRRRNRLRRVGRLAALALILALAGAAYYGARWPLQLRDGWKITDKIRLSRPASLALGSDGRLRYVALETIPGLLVELTPDGPKTVFGDFGEPDGLLALDDSVLVSETDRDGRVMAYNTTTARLRVLARMDKPEGLLRRPDGSTVVAQGVSAGRLWVLREGAEPAVLVDGLSSPKGLCDLPDGRIGIAESGTGRILAHGPAGLEVLAEDLGGIDQLACGADGSLWAVISRVRSGKLIRIAGGRQRTIARRLRQPQGIVLLPDGGLYLAESRANRVLRITPH
ncbi:MAG TPA: hypothetical protein VHN38_10870 [Immundisolibacter sp.]|nr:hypothetical protein [Immundisolibacter sp.]